MAIKVFKMHEKDYLDKDTINQWANNNNFKIDNVTVCPMSWYLNNDKTRVIEMELLVTVLYHKKRRRKEKQNESTTK